jgi:hypothetical protein
MIENISIPEELMINLGSESKEFAVKGKRANPPGRSISEIFFSIIWLGLTGFFISLFLGPLLQGDIIQGISDSIKESKAQGGQSILFPIILLGVFVAIGLFTFIKALIVIFRKGGYFVGTPTRLAYYKKGEMRSFDWEQFTGNITVRGTNKRGNITLEMRTGYMVRSKGGSRYVPNEVFISGIPDVYEIEQICRKRIKENDPTPSV